MSAFVEKRHFVLGAIRAVCGSGHGRVYVSRMDRDTLSAQLSVVWSESEREGAEAAAARAERRATATAWLPAGEIGAELPPLWHQRLGSQEPQVQHGEPPELVDVERLRLDSSGEVVLSETFDRGRRTSITVIERDATVATSATWAWDRYRVEASPHVFAAAVLTLCDGRPRSYVGRTMVGGLEFESYHYDGARLVAIENVQGIAGRIRTFDIDYDSHGSVALIVDRASGRAVFRTHLENRPAVEDAFVARMLVLVPQWIAALPIDGAADALVLGYDVNEHTLPPALAVRTPDRVVEAAGLTDQLEHRWELWAPADLSIFDPMPAVIADDAQIRATANDLNSLLWTSSDATGARSLLRRLASELNQIRWSDILPVTDGFAVVAMDFDLLEFDHDIIGSLGFRRAASILAAP
jgi:hypothetical protein